MPERGKRGSAEELTEGKDARRLTSGVAVNFLGAAGKIIDAAFFLIATRLFGPGPVGLFLFALAIADGVAKLAVQGFKDGAMMMVAQRHGTEKIDQVYDITAQALRWALLLSTILAIAFFLVAPWAAEAIWHKPEAGPVMQSLAVVMPLLALMQIPLAATKGLVIMKHEVITMQFFVPATMLVTAAVLGYLGMGATGLAIAIVVSHALGALFALDRFRREFSLGKLFSKMVRPARVGGLYTFAIPQGWNEFLNFGMTQLDIIVLAAFFAPEQLALYGIASRIALALRKVRMGFASAYSPLIARYHAQGQKERLERSYAMVTRWILVLAIPVVCVLVAVREPAMRLVHGSFTHDTEILWVLLVGPLVNALLGLAANVILMTGHSRLNLATGVAGAALSVALNLLLIPRWGLMGAATATAASMSLQSVLQALMARYVLGIRLRLGLVYKPMIAGLGAFCVIAAVWAFLGLREWWTAAPAAIACVLVFAVLLRALGLEEEDVSMLEGKGGARNGDAG